MGHKERKAYVDAIRRRYRRANKEQKTKILDEFCAICNYHRKYAIQLLWMLFRKNKPKIRKRGCRSIYKKDCIIKPLIKIWLATNQMCSKKLKAALPIWLPFFESEYGLLPEETKTRLLTISSSTIDRLLKPSKIK